MKQSSRQDIHISSEDWEEFERGVSYFNNGQFPHSLEAWELLWERKDSRDKVFFRGLMELTSACQCLFKNQDASEAIDSLEKARLKLQKFMPEYFGIPIEPLLEFIGESKEAVRNCSRNGQRKKGYPLPQIEFHKPDNPDLNVELCEILQSTLFLEGIKLFNGGFYWEAHEEWEEVWREQSGDGKIFVEAFVQMAEAFSFIKLGKAATAIYLFEKSIKKFAEYKRIRCTILISAIVADMKKTLDSLRMLSTNGKISIKPMKIQVSDNKRGE